MFRSKPLLLIGLGAALMLGGCSNKTHNSDGTPKAQNYPVDGYMGITSVNPNDPLNPTHHHYRDDVRLMRTVISRIPGIQDSAIQINGPRVNVDLELAAGTSEQDAKRIRDEAYHALSQNMPRYIVTVSTSRH